MIYSFQLPESIGRDIEKLELSAIVADCEDWTGEVMAAAERAGSAGVAIALTTPSVAAVEGWSVATFPSARRGRIGCGAADSHQRYHGAAEAAGDQDTVLERTVFSVTSGEKAPPGRPAGVLVLAVRRDRRVQLIAGVYNARRMVILERFTVDASSTRSRPTASPGPVCNPPSSACCSMPTCPPTTWRRWSS